jgi:L-glyceraldehyde 3-phosphate reductase
MAVAWVLDKPAVTSALIGARNWAQIEECLGALRNPGFSREELDSIDRYALDGGLNIWAESSRSG